MTTTVPAAAAATDGARLLDSVAGVGAAVEAGDWAGGLLSLLGGAAEAAALLADPLDELVAAGLGWLLEHVPQLRAPLDQLAGDRAGIDALAAGWQRAAHRADTASVDLHAAVDVDTAGWRGLAVETYRPVGYGLATAGATAAAGAGVVAVIVRKAGQLVLAVRAVVRDELAAAVADLITTFLRNVVVAGTGVGLLALAGLLVERAARWAVRLARWVHRVGEALTALRGLLARVAPALGGGAASPGRFGLGFALAVEAGKEQHRATVSPA